MEFYNHCVSISFELNFNNKLPVVRLCQVGAIDCQILSLFPSLQLSALVPPLLIYEHMPESIQMTSTEASNAIHLHTAMQDLPCLCFK